MTPIEAADKLGRVYEYLMRTAPWFDYWTRHEPQVQVVYGAHCDALRVVCNAEKELRQSSRLTHK